ncbi:hypothetical protein R6Q59_035058 [Mikania micrantha]
MGGCVSNHQKPSAQVLFDVKHPVINGDLATFNSAPTFGIKEETFFDSQAWLDSDCDDDFMSVNGEFTPSRGNTPVHHNFSAGNNKPPVAVSPYDPNGPQKKRLSDLFKDGLRGNYDSENEQGGQQVKNGLTTTLVHGGDVAPNAGNGLRERFGSCLPSLLPSRSSSTNGRKMMSPSPKAVMFASVGIRAPDERVDGSHGNHFHRHLHRPTDRGNEEYRRDIEEIACLRQRIRDLEASQESPPDEETETDSFIWDERLDPGHPFAHNDR